MREEADVDSINILSHSNSQTNQLIEPFKPVGQKNKESSLSICHLQGWYVLPTMHFKQTSLLILQNGSEFHLGSS